MNERGQVLSREGPSTAKFLEKWEKEKLVRLSDVLAHLDLSGSLADYEQRQWGSNKISVRQSIAIYITRSDG